MPPRPIIKARQNRPVSAIYLGKGGGGIGGPSPSLQDLSQSASSYANLISATPPNLPDLPEPELVEGRDEDGRSFSGSERGRGSGRGSDFEFEENERERDREMMESPSPTPISRRGGSVVKPGSGLPSPPATNSTGSGSTGDPATIRGESKTISRPLSLHSNSSNGASTSTESYRQQHQQHMRRSTSSSINIGSMVSGNGNGRLQDVEMDGGGGEVGLEGDYDDDYVKEDEIQRERREFDEPNDDDDDNADNESNVDDGDDTARMDRRFLDRLQERSSTENVLALQRVKNLAQRNRMALDKLSRLSPSPARTGSGNGNLGSSIGGSRSPAPPPPSSTTSSSASASSSSRLAANANNSNHTPSRLSQTQIHRQSSTSSTSTSSQQSDLHVHDLTRSGSETERESTRHSYSSSHSSSSHSHSNNSHHFRSVSYHQSSGSIHRSPALSLSQLTLSSPSPSHANLPPSTPHRSPYHRVRHISAPDSPEKVRVGVAVGMSLANEAGGSTSSLTRSPVMGRRRNRMSLASVSQLALSDQEEEREDMDADEDGRLRRRLRLGDGDDEDDPGLRTATVATTTGTTRRDRTLNERDMIIQSALAAAAASGGGAGGTRRSPLSARRRGALPREFRSQSQAGMVSSSGAGMQREGERMSPSPSPGTRRRESWRITEPMTPLRPQTTGQGRSATLRESTSTSASRRRPGAQDPRWSSEDLRSSTLRERDRTSYSTDRSNINSSNNNNRASFQNDRTYNTSHSTEEPSSASALTRTERRQSLRGGSAESALLTWSPGGRSLLGEGLRAAGLRPKRESEDLRGVVIPGVTGGKEPGSAGGQERDGERERRRATGEWSPQDVLDEGRRRVFASERERQREEKQPVRASTSMAQYQYLDRAATAEDNGGNLHRGRELRSHKSAYYLTSRDLERDSSVTRNVTHERAASALGGYHNTVTSPTPLHTTSGTTAHALDRMAASSPFTGSTRRYSSNTATPANANSLNASTASTVINNTNMSASQIQLEHTRLMLESLSMFEAQVAKLPQLGTSSTKSTPSTGASQVELARNAQGVVFAAERLSGMLRHGGMRALEAQVEAEVEASSSAMENKDLVVDVLGRVVAEYRDGSRVADELVRGITALLLGVGRVMRDFGAAAGSGAVGEFGTQSPNVHNRHLSLDYHGETGTPGHGGSSTESGRHSVASRRSWEPTPREKEREREETFKRLAGARPESVLARASPATFQKLKDREERDRASPVNASKLNASISGPRRLFTPREKREQMLDAARAEVIRGGANLATADSQETIHQQPIEPSPTPATRVQVKASPRERSKTLTPLSIPKPLPTLPSESTNRRQATTSTNVPTTAPLEKSTAATTGSTRERARRSTLRSSFPLITSPSNATTAITPHTVSNTPARSPFPLPRTDSDRSEGPSPGVTFSRPATGSISATLSDLHQQVERQRSTGGSSASISTGDSNSLQPPTGSNLSRSTSDVERDSSSREARRKTLGVSRTGMPRSSLDSATPSRAELNQKTNSVTVHAADRSAASTILQQSSSSTRERRRTVTEIWPQK